MTPMNSMKSNVNDMTKCPGSGSDAPPPVEDKSHDTAATRLSQSRTTSRDTTFILILTLLYAYINLTGH